MSPGDEDTTSETSDEPADLPSAAGSLSYIIADPHMRCIIWLVLAELQPVKASENELKVIQMYLIMYQLCLLQ